MIEELQEELYTLQQEQNKQEQIFALVDFLNGFEIDVLPTRISFRFTELLNSLNEMPIIQVDHGRIKRINEVIYSLEQL